VRKFITTLPAPPRRYSFFSNSVTSTGASRDTRPAEVNTYWSRIRSPQTATFLFRKREMMDDREVCIKK